MKDLEKQIKKIALEEGAALVGIASMDRFAQVPPSGDPAYLLPSAQSVISLAVPFESESLKAFFGKEDWRPFNFDKKAKTQLLFVISDHITSFLKEKGFEALTVDINNNYRPEEGVRDATELVSMLPEFSHRYGALAAGLGRLGWSGNLMTPEYGAAVMLGTVLTSAKLESDPLLKENPCDGCKMCVASCPVEMMPGKESVTVTVAGITEEIAKKRAHNRCWIGCSGYHGLSTNGKWSNWSPYRVPSLKPGDDTGIDELCTRIRKADPDMCLEGENTFTHFRQAFFNPENLTFSPCGNCSNLCWKERKDRIENLKLLKRSGFVALGGDGERTAVHHEDEIVEMDTPFHMKVAVLRKDYDAALRGELSPLKEKADSLCDDAVLKHLRSLG